MYGILYFSMTDKKNLRDYNFLRFELEINTDSTFQRHAIDINVETLIL